MTDPTESFDPLFYGISNWGTWVQGEIVGEYLLFNSNEIAHQIKLSTSPSESFGLGLMYFHFDLDKKQYFGTPVNSSDFADEIDVYADWEITPKLWLSAVAGVAFPGAAAQELFGSDKPTSIFEVLVKLNY